MKIPTHEKMIQLRQFECFGSVVLRGMKVVVGAVGLDVIEEIVVDGEFVIVVVV